MFFNPKNLAQVLTEIVQNVIFWSSFLLFIVAFVTSLPVSNRHPCPDRARFKYYRQRPPAFLCVIARPVFVCRFHPLHSTGADCLLCFSLTGSLILLFVFDALFSTFSAWDHTHLATPCWHFKLHQLQHACFLLLLTSIAFACLTRFVSIATAVNFLYDGRLVHCTHRLLSVDWIHHAHLGLLRSASLSFRTGFAECDRIGVWLARCRCPDQRSNASRFVYNQLNLPLQTPYFIFAVWLRIDHRPTTSSIFLFSFYRNFAIKWSFANEKRAYLFVRGLCRSHGGHIA